MGFLAWLRKIQYALHKCAESIRNADEGKKEQCLPSDKPVEVRAVVSYDRDTIAEAKAQAKSEGDTQKSIKKAAWATFAAVAIYAFITLCMWVEMRRSTTALQGQLNLMRDADRPWIAVDVSINSQLTYDKNGVHVGFNIIPKNIGRSTAQVAIQAILKPSTMGDDLGEVVKRVCHDIASDGGRWPLRYVLFPGDHYIQPTELGLSAEEIDSYFRGELPAGTAPPDLIPITLVGCADYTYESSPRHHQTGIAIDVLMKDGRLVLKSLTPLAPDSLILRQHPFGGHFAN
jgi:hypothetical protein